MSGAGAILYPMGALALLTFTVLLLIPIRRIAAVRKGALNPGDFRLGESARVPGEVALPNRNYMNLLELPLLFYVACLMFYVTGRVDGVTLGLAWAYVALRTAHSIVHIGYNNVLHRLIAFAASNLVLIALWIDFFASAAR